MNSLDPSQLSVVDVTVNQRQVVIAAPGSGKTFTAVELIKHINSQLNSPGEYNVIYISFSNAAISAATGDQGDELRDLDLLVDAGTLDSFANALVDEAGLNFDHTSNFFEERVKAAVDIISSGETSYFDETIHLIIDEAQDIYGLRKQLALELIKFLPPECGVTVLGDPMQSIYSFLGTTSFGNSIDESSDSSLLLHLIDQTGANPKRLIGQYRATSGKMKRIHERLRSIDHSTPQEVQASLLEHALNEATVIDEPNLAYWSKKWGPNTALLTRNNAEVLLLCGALARHSVTVSPLFPPDQRLRFPSWISEWADQVGARPFAPTSLFEFLETRDPDDLNDAKTTGYDFTRPWEESTLYELRTAFLRRPTHSAHPTSQKHPLVSTIHQSKGRQFETVVLINPFDLLRDDPFYGIESELAYVGITRARRKLQLLDLKFPSIRSFQAPHYRSVVRSFARSSPQAVEVRPSDIDREAFYGEAAGQEALSSLSPTAKLEFALVHQDAPVPRYRVQSNGVTVGLTNVQFGESLSKLTRSRQGSWPSLGPVMHDGTETVFGNEVVQGRSCWLIPRAFGFASISFI